MHSKVSDGHRVGCTAERPSTSIGDSEYTGSGRFLFRELVTSGTCDFDYAMLSACNCVQKIQGVKRVELVTTAVACCTSKHLGLSFEPLEAFLEPPGMLMRVSWSLLGCTRRPLGASWGALGRVLGSLGRLWGRLGGVLAPLGPS